MIINQKEDYTRHVWNNGIVSQHFYTVETRNSHSSMICVHALGTDLTSGARLPTHRQLPP